MVAAIRIVSGFALRIVRYFFGYYESEQTTGQWIGTGAALLGLKGDVTREHFEAVLCGRAPSGKQLVKPFCSKANVRQGTTNSKPLEQTDTKSQAAKSAKKPHDTQSETEPKRTIRKRKAKRRNALAADQPYHVPKSVSVLAALVPKHRPAIECAVVESVTETLHWFERTVPLARRGKAGVNRIHADLIIAQFLHRLSRDEQPHLHVHNVIAMLARGADGKWCKPDSHLIHLWTPTLGRIFRAFLAYKLEVELGLELIRPVDARGRELTSFEIKGIPQKVLEENSSRRQELLKAAGKQGLLKGPEAAKLRQQAAYKTRKAKRKGVDLNEVYERCREQALKHGITAESLERLIGRAKPLRPEQRKELYRKAFDAAIKKLSNERTHFGERELLVEVVERLQHCGFKGGDLADRVLEDLPRRPELLQLKDAFGERRFTTKQMWKLEERFLKDVDALRKRKGALLSHSQTEKVIREHKHLTIEQKKAVRRLLSRKRAIRVLTGVAGSGKSTALEAVRKGFEDAGYKVIGGALAGVVARDLQSKVGIKSRTVASYVWWLDRPLTQRVQQQAKHHLRMLIRELRGKKTWAYSAAPVKLNARSVLVIDEAGMLASKELAVLTRLVRKAGATLLLIGDSFQLAPIGVGAPFSRLIKDLPSADLTNNIRQQDPVDREAVANLREGKIAEALKSYADRGRLLVADDRTDAMSKLVTTWTEGGGATNPKAHQILVQTRRDAAVINAMCQQARLDAKGCPPGRSLSAGRERYFAGDRILFYKGISSSGILNGDYATVVGVDTVARKLMIRLEKTLTKEERARGLRQVISVPVPSHANDVFCLSYATTTHKLQGATVDHAYLLMGGSLSGKEMAYVQSSRARKTTRLFVDKENAGEGLIELVRSLKRSQAKELAHDLGLQQSR